MAGESNTVKRVESSILNNDLLGHKETTVKKILGLTAIIVSSLLTGCGQDAKISVTPDKGVEQIERASATGMDVYCPSGICKFSVETTAPTELTVTMNYQKDKPFKKIEGVNVIGEIGGSVHVLNQHQFTLNLEKTDQKAQIQVVDYYRN